MPFAMSNINIRSDCDIVGRPAAKDGERRQTYVTIATPGYFSAMSIPLSEGRLLEARDNETSQLVAVISDALRRREWPGESPVGRRIRVAFAGQALEAEVVGVVSPIRHDGLDTVARPEVFLAFPQLPFGSMTYVVRGPGEPAALLERVKHQIWCGSDAVDLRHRQRCAPGAGLARAAALQHDGHVRVRPRRAVPLRERHLRHHQFHDYAADAGDWAADGARGRWSTIRRMVLREGSR